MRPIEDDLILIYQPQRILSSAFGIDSVVSYILSDILSFPLEAFYTTIFPDPASKQYIRLSIGDMIVYILNSFLEARLLLPKMHVTIENNSTEISYPVVVPNFNLITELEITAYGKAISIAAVSETRLADRGLLLDLDFYISCVENVTQYESPRQADQKSPNMLVKGIESINMNTSIEFRPTSRMPEYSKKDGNLCFAFINSLLPLAMELQVPLLELYAFLFYM